MTVWGCVANANLQNWPWMQTMVLHFLIQGRVQGVGFRWYVHREASELDLRGWVRNTEDGEVEVVASGEQGDLADLRASLRRGPRGSRVDRLIENYLDESEAEGLSSFRIEGRTGATDQDTAAFQNAQQTMQGKEAVQSGDLPSGVNDQLQSALLTNEAAQKSSDQKNITLQNENLRESNYWNAINGLTEIG